MLISNYVTIDGKKYKVLATDYKRGFEPAKTVRRGVLGNTIVTTGIGEADRMVSAVLFIPLHPDTGWGRLTDLEDASEKRSVAYTDHITDDVHNILWGSGTYTITITKADIMQLKGAPHPAAGYEVYVEWMSVLTGQAVPYDIDMSVPGNSWHTMVAL